MTTAQMDWFYVKDKLVPPLECEFESDLNPDWQSGFQIIEEGEAALERVAKVVQVDGRVVGLDTNGLFGGVDVPSVREDVGEVPKLPPEVQLPFVAEIKLGNLPRHVCMAFVVGKKCGGEIVPV